MCAVNSDCKLVLTIRYLGITLNYQIKAKMKDSKAVLYSNDHVAAKVTSYSEDHTLNLPKEIIDYHAWIVETQEMSNYTISTFQAKSHVWLARLIGAKRSTSHPTFPPLPQLIATILTLHLKSSRSGPT